MSLSDYFAGKPTARIERPAAYSEQQLALMTKDELNAACMRTVDFALQDIKAQNIVQIDISKNSQFADMMVIASGTSTRHVKALADNVAVEGKAAGFRPIGIEGERDAEWILVDFGAIVVHVMLPATRKFYDLEGMWQNPNPGQI